MSQETTSIQVFWDGPYSWPGFEDENMLPTLPRLPGVYLQTFEYQEGYLIYAAGLTRRPVPVRFREHTRHYMNGEYNVLDLAAAQQGIRKEIWHGWGYARDHRDQFEEQKSKILDAVRRQLAGFRIFIADVGSERRLPERIEASIMNHLSQQPPPYCDIPDKGMMLAARWQDEHPLLVNNRSKVRLHGLPEFLEI
jgi:hypothetical protein